MVHHHVCNRLMGPSNCRKYALQCFIEKMDAQSIHLKEHRISFAVSPRTSKYHHIMRRNSILASIPITTTHPIITNINFCRVNGGIHKTIKSHSLRNFTPFHPIIIIIGNDSKRSTAMLKYLRGIRNRRTGKCLFHARVVNSLFYYLCNIREYIIGLALIINEISILPIVMFSLVIYVSAKVV